MVAISPAIAEAIISCLSATCEAVSGFVASNKALFALAVWRVAFVCISIPLTTECATSLSAPENAVADSFVLRKLATSPIPTAEPKTLIWVVKSAISFVSMPLNTDVPTFARSANISSKPDSPIVALSSNKEFWNLVNSALADCAAVGTIASVTFLSSTENLFRASEPSIAPFSISLKSLAVSGNPVFVTYPRALAIMPTAPGIASANWPVSSSAISLSLDKICV